MSLAYKTIWSESKFMLVVDKLCTYLAEPQSLVYPSVLTCTEYWYRLCHVQRARKSSPKSRVQYSTAIYGTNYDVIEKSFFGGGYTFHLRLGLWKVVQKPHKKNYNLLL